MFRIAYPILKVFCEFCDDRVIFSLVILLTSVFAILSHWFCNYVTPILSCTFAALMVIAINMHTRSVTINLATLWLKFLLIPQSLKEILKYQLEMKYSMQKARVIHRVMEALRFQKTFLQFSLLFLLLNESRGEENLSPSILGFRSPSPSPSPAHILCLSFIVMELSGSNVYSRVWG